MHTRYLVYLRLKRLLRLFISPLLLLCSIAAVTGTWGCCRTREQQDCSPVLCWLLLRSVVLLFRPLIWLPVISLTTHRCNELEVLDRCVEILHLSSLSVSCICVLRKSSSNPTRNRTVVYGNYVCAVSELGGGVVACVVGVVGERVRETCGGNKGNGVRWPSAQLQL